MPAHRLHQTSLAELALAYGMTRAGIAVHARKYGRDIVANPDALFLALLESGNASRLRSRLSCPHFRAAAADQLQSLATP